MGGKKEELNSYSPLPSSNPSYHQNVVVLLPYYPPHYHRRRRRRCHIYSAALFLFLLFSAAIFLLYPSDPEIQLARIRINHIGIRTNPKPILDLAFSLTVKVRNRDFFSLNYDSLVVSVGYRGRQLGFVSSVDGGWIKARGSSYVDVLLSVDGFEVIYDAFYLIQDISKGVIPFDADTRVEGKLGLFFFDIPLKTTVSCQLYVNIKEQTIMRQDCYPESLGEMMDQNTDIVAGDLSETMNRNMSIGAGDT